MGLTGFWGGLLLNTSPIHQIQKHTTL